MSSYGVYTQRYFADSGQIQYEQRRLNCHRKSLLEYSPAFFNQLTTALKAKFRVHSVDSFVLINVTIQLNIAPQHPLFIVTLIAGY